MVPGLRASSHDAHATQTCRRNMVLRYTRETSRISEADPSSGVMKLCYDISGWLVLFLSNYLIRDISHLPWIWLSLSDSYSSCLSAVI